MSRKMIAGMKYSVLTALLLLSISGVLQAQTGNIDPVDKWAWGTNVGWLNFRPVNGGVTVYADHLEGYAWAENIGWIRLGTHESNGGHSYDNTSATNYGVNRDVSGNLSGYAWGTNVGWINFNPTYGGVTIDPLTGSFDGYAWGENIGWIHFKNTSPAYNVVTTFTDTDGDGVDDATDNCPGTFNPDQANGDGDGAGTVCDCDDANPNNYPGNAEVCDGQDNDCDGLVDQNDPDFGGSSDFDVSAVPAVARVEWFGGFLGTATYDVTVSSVDCYTSSVSLSVTGLPPGTRRYYFDPGAVVTVPARGSETVMLVVQVTRSVGVGDYLLTIVGDDGSATKTDDVTLEVRRPSRERLVAKAGAGVPEEFVLSQNYPNPFNPETTIEFGLPEEGQVRLRVYNMLGQIVGDLVDDALEAGYYSISWDATQLPAGVYFYRIETDNDTDTRRMVLMK
ncbi:MAG: T9SS type A sorting domain-containing protein [Gemmatimonadota bacterium]|nr:MAG: T9SS type A sorting domain-containing protein [Gemmatimonadota bacterium]